MGGRGPGGQLGAKRLVQAKRQPKAVGKGRRLQLSTRFSAGARKPPATPQGACPPQALGGLKNLRSAEKKLF